MKILLPSLFGLILFTACTVGSTVIVNTEEPTNPLVVATTGKITTPNFADIDQATEAPDFTATLSPVVKLTLSAAPDLENIQACPKVNGSPVDLSQLTKVGIVLVKSGADIPWSLVDLQTGKSIPLPHEGEGTSTHLIGEAKESPDRKNLAYLEFVANSSGKTTNEILRVVNSKGMLVTSQIFSSGEFIQEWHWLNREQLEIIFPADQAKGSVSLFNPFVKQWQSLTDKFPDRYQDFALRPSSWSAAYSPDMKWVIYLGQVAPDAAGPVVWDVSSARVIWQSTSSFSGNQVPQWSPGGNEVAVVVNGTLYRINHQGQAEYVPLGDAYQVINFSWAPDGQHIAILARDQLGADSGRLLVHNISSRETIDFCNIRDISYLHPAPIWSPDSHMLIDFLPLTGESLLIDVDNRVEYQLGRDNIRAWMSAVQ